ncbi:MAG: extracellular solute-binding protein [Actinomycetota bacterium]
MRRIAVALGILCLVGGIVASASLAAKAPPKKKAPTLKINPIFTYNKADREQHLYQCAKQEGSVTLYTSSSATDTSLKPAFQAQYPGVSMNTYVATSPLVTRLESEEDAGHHNFDVYNDALGNIERTSKYFQPFWSPYGKLMRTDMGTTLSSPWLLASNGYVQVGVYYNPNTIPTSQVPKTWKDLLSPQYTGKVYIGTDSTSPAFVALLRRTFGTAFYSKLAKQVRVVNVSGRGVADMIEAGTAPMGIDMSSSYYQRDHIAKNAPLLLQVLQPAMAQFQASSISKYAPHPCAAMLLVDWLSNPKEGGAVFTTLGNALPFKTAPILPFQVDGQLPVAKWDIRQQTAPKTWTGFKSYAQAYGAWTDLFNRYFLGGH